MNRAMVLVALGAVSLVLFAFGPWDANYFSLGGGGAIGIIRVLLVIIGLNLIGFGVRAHTYYRLPLFTEYKASNPDLVHSNGKVKCNICGDTQRRTWRWSMHWGPAKHFCSQCGTALYRS